MTLLHPSMRRAAPSRAALPSRARGTDPTPDHTVDHTADRTSHLVAGLRAGDEHAMREIVRTYGAVVFRVAFNALGRQDLAEEATQETFLRAWRAADRFDEERGSLGPWLTTIAYRVAIDVHRRERRAPSAPLDEAHVPAVVVDARTMESAEAVGRVRQAISTLAPDDAELVRLHHFHGLTYADIGRRLGVPEGTVKSRSFRVRRELVSLLADLAPEPARRALAPSL
jgi:RNA polymerase sigma-70 factor, ECF subfamily